MSKNIVVCYDGTGNEYGKHNTNVVCLFQRLKKDAKQVAFYDPGVGTFSAFGRRIFKRIGIWMGLAFGFGLTKNIEDGYRYLMNNYQPGDNVYIFGFSRGAFTARSLAGMIYKFGLLQKGSINLIPYVTENYLNRSLDKKIMEGFKRTYSTQCKIHFIGVWDTVASLGHVRERKFPDGILNEDVKHGYQAVSIDEKRKKFPVSLWNEERISSGQQIEQVWFSGVHSDVGGYYLDRGLSDIALGWMLDRAEQKGLRLIDGWQNQLNQNHEGKLHQSRQGFYKIWKPVKRKIPTDSCIHQSVFYRMQNIDTYRPELPDKYEVKSNQTYDRYMDQK